MDKFEKDYRILKAVIRLKMFNEGRYNKILAGFWSNLVPVIVSTAAILLFFDYGGLKLSYDSFDYLKASENLGLYLGGKNQDGYSYVNRAPLLHAYLHFFDKKVEAAWWLNALSFVLSFVLVYRIGKQLGLSNIFLLGLLIAICFSYPWLQNHFFLWTEPLFSALILLLAFCLIRNTHIVFIALICAISFYLRKAGVVLFVGAGIYYLCRGEYRSLIMISGVAVCVFVSWIFVEVNFVDENPSVINVNYLVSLTRSHYADVLSSWIFPRIIPLSIRLFLNAILFLVLGIFFKEHLIQMVRSKAVQVVLILFSTYLLTFLVFFGTPEYMEAERFLSVVLPLCLLLVFGLAQQIYDNGTRIHRFVFFSSLVLWMIYPIARTLSHFWH